MPYKALLSCAIVISFVINSHYISFVVVHNRDLIECSDLANTDLIANEADSKT